MRIMLQSLRAEQSRAEQANCALFAAFEAYETEYNIRDG